MYKLCSDLYIVFYSVQGKLDLIWVINSVMIVFVPFQLGEGKQWTVSDLL